MSGALLGIVALAALFALAAVIPLRRGSCHGSCEEDGMGEACRTCPFGLVDEEPLGEAGTGARGGRARRQAGFEEQRGESHWRSGDV